MVDKRGHEDGDVAPESKRAKVEAGGAPAAASAPRVSAEMLAKLEKTKKLLQAQKELQEKLKKLPQVRWLAAAAAARRSALLGAAQARPQEVPVPRACLAACAMRWQLAVVGQMY
jgi:hypothetical protein